MLVMVQAYVMLGAVKTRRSLAGKLCVHAWETKALGENRDFLEVCGSREKAGSSGCSGGSDLHPC